MEDYNQEYYFMKSTGIDFPMLDYAGSQPIKNSNLFYSREAIDDSKVIPLMFARPIPRNPKLADVLHVGGSLVISERLKDHLSKLKLKDVQFIPATIQDDSDEVHEGYFIIHIHNIIRCADLKKSKWTRSVRNPDRVQSFDKLILDNEALDKIPLDSRLVVALQEENSERIYHQSIANHILSLRPTGVSFYRVAGYKQIEPFEDEFLEQIESED